MSLKNFLMMGSACTWRYLIILSLLHLPMRLMMPWYTPEQRKAMEPASQRYLCRDVMMRESQMGSREEFYGGLEVGCDFS